MEKGKLFDEFPPVSTDQWKKQIMTDLKGADYGKKLVWKTGEGFDVQPFYREEDLHKLENLQVCPGDYPFLRGKHVSGNPWLVRQDIEVADMDAANAKALDIRMKGVDSIGFQFDPAYKPVTGDIEQLLHNIRADLMELNYESAYPLEVVNIIDSLSKKYNRDLDKVRGSVHFDPLGFYSREGRFRRSQQEDFSMLEQLFQSAGHLSGFHVLTVDGSAFHNAGSGIVTQLAFALAKGADYLNYLTGKGFEIDDIAPRIRFHFAVGSSYFMEIAKFRAARYLWANIVNAYGLNDASGAGMFIHCSSSLWNKTIYDPYVNMLRTTTETLSAAIGGVDSMTVAPFDAALGQPMEFSERIARNQQLLLKGESYLDKVNDPAAGSYYIEMLTQQVINEAWKLFLETDDRGGYLEAFRSGYITGRIAEEASEKRSNISTRKRVLLGTNQFPNISEHHEKPIEEEVTSSGENLLKPQRGALEFEIIRSRTDSYALTHDRPVAWMFTYGNLAMRNARAQFASNFFGCAGFGIVNNPGFETIEKGIKAARDARPDIVVICSSDEEYAGAVLTIFNQLKKTTVVVLAGYPQEFVGQLRDAGFEHFIHTRSNVLEELKKYQTLLGIS